MKLERTDKALAGKARGAFTLMEVVIAVAIIGVAFGSLYVGFRQSFGVIQLSRENLRATQILQEKMETIRLFDWTAINALPTPYYFTNTFYPVGSTTNQGVIYSGTRIITDSPLTAENYGNDLKLVTFRLTWSSGGVQRQREMTTLVSRYGLHNYIFYGH